MHMRHIMQRKIITITFIWYLLKILRSTMTSIAIQFQISFVTVLRPIRQETHFANEIWNFAHRDFETKLWTIRCWWRLKQDYPTKPPTNHKPLTIFAHASSRTRTLTLGNTAVHSALEEHPSRRLTDAKSIPQFIALLNINNRNHILEDGIIVIFRCM